MAVPCSFPEENEVLGRPKGMTADQCEPLNVCRTSCEDGTPALVSCWKLTHEELEEINKTGRIYLIVAGEGMPAVMLNVLRPFVTD